MAEFEPKAVWPGWETVRILGRGSFGAVYEIRRKVFGETEKAALKLITIPQSATEIEELRDEGLDDESITDTFKDYLKSIVAEYSLMRKLNGCSNVVSCDDVRYVQHEDGFGWDIYIKMELLTPLNKALPKEIPDETVIRVGTDLCKALVLCKKHNIIHRDIKPANIFVSDNGDYKLGDFGIAKTVEKTSGGTKTGTYEYMAPEVYLARPYGSAVDIYSLGMVLYWLLNERRTPFLALPPALPTGMDKEQARSRRFNGEAIPAPAHGSPALQRIVLKAVAYDPKDRYRSAEDMLRDLEKLEGNSEFGVRNSELKEDRRSAAPVGAVAPGRPCPRADVSSAPVGTTTGRPRPGTDVSSKSKKKTGLLIGALAAVLALVLALVFWPRGEKKEAEASSQTLENGFEAANPFRDVTVGDIIEFGKYEQDNNLANGKEEIEWLVLAKEENRILVISKYALDCRPYNETQTAVTWETCTLRSWLNGSFLEKAFGEQEQAMILTVTVKADKNPDYDTDPGKDTEDRVFLLSIPEANTYFASDEERLCIPTEYAIAQGAWTNESSKVDGRDVCKWWLRSPGSESLCAARVRTIGAVSYDGNYAYYSELSVRPAIWIDLAAKPGKTGAEEAAYTQAEALLAAGDYDGAAAAFVELGDYRDSAGRAGECRTVQLQAGLRDSSVGDIVKFGKYEQDNNTANGKEEIEWLVLAKEENRILVVSKYALDCRPYNETQTAVTWETCSLRIWLNGSFLEDAFREEERAMIPLVTVSADRNPNHDTDPGNDTKDRVFLLSIPEANTYFASDEVRRCAPTDYAIAKGASPSDSSMVDGRYACRWWLRSPGSNSGCAAHVYRGGYANADGDSVLIADYAVRPALWIDLGS